MTTDGASDFAAFDALFSDPAVADAMRAVSPTAHAAASAFWKAPSQGGHLSPRMRELAYFAMHVAATALNGQAVARQVDRILLAGGTREDIVDVLVTIVGVANHALYASVPVLEEEWAAAGKAADDVTSDQPALEAAKRRFVAIRGFWNPDRDPLARQMPAYFAALTDISTESWENGSLTRKERELICIAIDCNVTHSYPPGLRIHIRNAIREGAGRGEILEVLQLAALMGLEGYVLAAEAMFGSGGR
jgi:alkylhydroperoxidase/carboxymuconolactone decarboxylase family protein YurZ